MDEFYDRLAPFYHLIFQDWDAAIDRQSERLARVIADVWDDGVRSVLDVSCGIGTQAIGLAQEGFEVTASDLSPGSIERARAEASTRGVSIEFSVCDMRRAHEHHGTGFDLVISCDNSIPHLLGDEAILIALREFHACARPDGGCLLTVRDYDAEERGRGLMKPYGIREDGDRRFLLFQVWDFEGDQYDLSFYIVEDRPDTGVVKTHVMRSRYYAIGADRLQELMGVAGFCSVRRIESDVNQVILVGTREA